MSLTKIFITRWALTEGILVWEPTDPADVKVEDDGSLKIERWHRDYIDGHGEMTESQDPSFIVAGEWAPTEEEAVVQARALAARKAGRLEARLSRLQRMATGRSTVSFKPAKKSCNWRAWGIDE